MVDGFKELLQLLNISDIRFMDSHESVLRIVYPTEKSEVEIMSETQFPEKSPQVENDVVVFYPKYIFTFKMNNEDFFTAEYILSVSFSSSNVTRVLELLENKEIKDMFLQKQMNRTLWSILRGTLLDAFNRHSLQPVVLPWIIS